MSRLPKDSSAHRVGDDRIPVQLIATVSLALCTLVAATAVSIGIAQADLTPTGWRLHLLGQPACASFTLRHCHSPVTKES
jgi:hypothetical protein